MDGKNVMKECQVEVTKTVGRKKKLLENKKASQ